MGGSRQPLEISPRRRTILRAIMPLGIVLLIAWVAWLGVLLVTGAEIVPALSGAFGIATSLMLIWSGVLYRRDLGDG
jgi:hypothetical protein